MLTNRPGAERRPPRADEALIAVPPARRAALIDALRRAVVEDIAVDALGSSAAAVAWLHRPCADLQHARPTDRITTADGAADVLALLRGLIVARTA